MADASQRVQAESSRTFAANVARYSVTARVASISDRTRHALAFAVVSHSHVTVGGALLAI